MLFRIWGEKDFFFLQHRINILFSVLFIFQKPCLINYQRGSLTAKICQFSQSNQGVSQTKGANGKLNGKPSTAPLILGYGSTFVNSIEVCCTEWSPGDHSITLSLSNQDPALSGQSVSTEEKKKLDTRLMVENPLLCVVGSFRGEKITNPARFSL